jgi:predicted transcriptional regulator
VDELTRVMALHLRYSGAPQVALVHDLTKLGLQPAGIAELLGTTRNTVSQQKRDKRPEWPVVRDDR